MPDRSQAYRRAALALIALCFSTILAAGDVQLWRDKVHPDVLRQAALGPVEFLVVLAEQADVRDADALATRSERGAFVYTRLREIAARTQAPLLEKLRRSGVEVRPFWIANMIWVRADASVLEEVASRSEVLRVSPNPRVRMAEPIPDSGEGAVRSIEWNILQVRADDLWALGFTGQGVVVGGQDTGYDWDHPALLGHYRGWNGSTAAHDYNWHDSIHSGGGSCGANSSVPCDDHGHGTHTMGTMVGDDGGTNRVGMAPGAQWIGCRNMNVGVGSPATYTECFEWFVAPTDASGDNPDPAKAPHVINNSWGCPPDEGCDFDTLATVVGNTRAAGIVVVASAGNSGSGCGSVSSPPAIYSDAFSVGATDSSDTIASFSSRGPVTVDGSNRLKPEVSAPGVGVRSSTAGGGYGSLSGTSMAGPHVAGLVALLLGARPDLMGDVKAIQTIIASSALPLTTTQTCGGIPGSAVPNNTYGRGRIDAVEMLLGDADGDGVDNLTDCRPTAPSVWSVPGPATDLTLSGQTETLLSWTAPAATGATAAPRYDVLRSSLRDDFSGATCVETNTTAVSVSDDDPATDVFYYLVRVRNGCGDTLGHASDGTPRSGAGCP